MRENRIMFGVSIIVILMVTMPYIYAFQAAEPGHVFGGFLVNPIDGHSYLAKMQLGYRGEWKFTLPYTAEKGNGAFLFLFYIILGHLARIFNAELIIIFHGARIVGAVFLLWSASKFADDIFLEGWQKVTWFTISTLGAGFGWVAVLFGLFTSDFWVAEAYPFLSMYTNPHFTLGLGLMLLVLSPKGKWRGHESLIFGFSLGIIQPFSVVIIILVLAVRMIDELTALSGSIKERIKNIQSAPHLILFGLGGGIVLGYQFIVIQTAPLLSKWNLQNVTPPPGILDLLLSFSPCLIIALIGIKGIWQTEGGRTMVFWAGISLCLIFIPWNLQRRFLTGLFIPISGLAVLSLNQLLNTKQSHLKMASILIVLLVIPTNLIVVLSGIQASSRNDPSIYWEENINAAFEWIKKHTFEDSVFLADEANGLYIPSQTGRRVIYGHPFETVEAESQLDFTRNFFDGKFQSIGIREELQRRDIEFVLTTMDLGQINQDLIKNEFPVVYKNSGVLIYKVE